LAPPSSSTNRDSSSILRDDTFLFWGIFTPRRLQNLDQLQRSLQQTETLQERIPFQDISVFNPAA
jgi:hypothetical protein